MASTHILTCECCGKDFEISRTFKKPICPECKVGGSTCPVCGKKMPFGKKYCSYSCNSKHNMSIYNPMDDEANRKKISTVKQERYGAQWAEAKRKREEAAAEYRAGSFQRRSEAQKAAAARAKERGTLFGRANPEVKARIDATMIERYGGIGMGSPVLQEKARQTNLEKYGAENPAHSDAIRKKISQNVSIARANPEVIERTSRTLKERYGVSNAFLVGAENRSSTFASTAEDEIADFVKSLGIEVVRHNHSLLGDKELDIYCPNEKIAIEYNGMYWHSSKVKESKLYHYHKTKACQEKGIRLIHIYEWEWQNPVKQEILKSLLRISFGKVEHPIYARQCEIRNVLLADYREFCEANHLQGYRAAPVVYGLYYKDQLQQLMSFATPQKRGAKETFQWEIVRGCPGSNNIVVGGVSKLWKHFLKEQQPESVMSYCDLNKFDGKSYSAIGMSLYKTQPANVWYIDRRTGKVQQWLFRNRERREDMLANSFEVYGAGNLTFVWRKDENKINS